MKKEVAMRPNCEVVNFTTKIGKTKIKAVATINYNGVTDVDGWYIINSNGQKIQRRFYAAFIENEEGACYFDYNGITGNIMQTTEELVTYALAKILASTNVCGDTIVNQSTLNNYLKDIHKNIKKY